MAEAVKGSQRWLQILVNAQPQLLNKALLKSAGLSAVFVKIVDASDFMGQADLLRPAVFRSAVVGLRTTSSTGCQFRTWPDHRFGLFLLASS